MADRGDGDRTTGGARDGASLRMEARRFPPARTSPRAARQFVHGLLAGVPDDESDLALVLTSELVTNAVVHARTDVDVRVELGDGLVRVTVRDGDGHLPHPRVVPPDAAGGRGLHLVRALASSWGVDRDPGGKIVWFVLAHGRPTA